jgi:hypothetical protein
VLLSTGRSAFSAGDHFRSQWSVVTKSFYSTIQDESACIASANVLNRRNWGMG